MDRPLLTGTWLPVSGEVNVLAPGLLSVQATSAAGAGFAAEAHHGGVLGADFRYSAMLDGDWARPGLGADLQFRISDEGRYGVRVQAGRVSLYRLMLESKACSAEPGVVAHCPLWGASDDPVEVELAGGDFDPGIGALRVDVAAFGPLLSVSFGAGAAELGGFQAEDFSLAVGRFGIYLRSDRRWAPAVFSEVAAMADPAADSNFALLYSTPGYDLTGTKRVLVRTLNDLEPADIDVTGCSFSVLDEAGHPVIKDRSFTSPGGGLGRTFGMQVLEGDFSDLRKPGKFELRASVATSGGVRELDSSQFDVRHQLVSQTMLWPMSIANARARRAADDDFRRNWRAESGLACWSVGVDGAFVADRADDQAGATLLRVFDTANAPLDQTSFRFTCQITIIRGCDAQLQFWVGAEERWAVTVQAGDAGGCGHGTGPGAVRLHREGPGLFDPVASYRLDADPFQAGRAYDVEVSAEQNHIEVFLDGVQVIDFRYPGQPSGGGFGLKAWASTVRFEHAMIWARQVALSRPWPGRWIPYHRDTGLSSQGFAITVPDYDPVTGAADPHDVLFPYAAQQHGFNDCNNSIGEVTSHGVFLSALMAIWRSRASDTKFGPAYQDMLRESILAAVLYLNELFDQGNRSGAFGHQEPGRGALSASTDPILNTQFALYGLSSFAADGLAVDQAQARQAFDLASAGWDWLEVNNGRDPVVDSVVASRMAVAAGPQGRPAGDWQARVRASVTQVLLKFSPLGAMAGMMRPTLRSIPWFEGVYEAVANGLIQPSELERFQFASIADQLEALLNDTANAFGVIPQSDDDRPVPDPDQPARNWNDLADLPAAHKAIPSPSVGDWYLCTHFLTAAADSVYIGRLARRDALERLATGNLHWALGLNPGLPASKVVGPQPGSRPWSAASFVYNGPGDFARTIEGWRTRTSSAKTWLAPWETTSAWETPSSSRHRECWWFAIADNGFQTIVNGHTLREDQWDYWSTGIDGRVSGETFILDDGCFLRAALALEDWYDDTDADKTSPYNLSRPRFFDTAHLDRAGTPWLFDDPDITVWAQAQRMATDFAAGKGYGGCRLTGHHIGERVGVLCLPATATTFVDITDGEIAALDVPYRFTDINAEHWAKTGRAAIAIAINRGFAAGYFTGHQLPGRPGSPGVHGWIGLSPDLISVFDLDDNDSDVQSSQWRFPDINTVPWAQAARLATDVCINRGFAGGFFTGHQLPGRRQVVAFSPELS